MKMATDLAMHLGRGGRRTQESVWSGALRGRPRVRFRGSGMGFWRLQACMRTIGQLLALGPWCRTARQDWLLTLRLQS